MKLSLRNLALAAVVSVAGVTFAQDGPTVTQKWIQHIGIASGDFRSGTGVNGTVYMSGNSVIKAINADGVKDYTFSGATFNKGMSSDDAGNLFVLKGWPTGAGTNTAYLIKPDMTTIVEVPVQAPVEDSGYPIGRSDVQGGAIGDFFSEEGGALFIASSGSTKPICVRYANGEPVDVEYACSQNMVAANSMASAVPSVSDVADLEDEPENKFYYRSGSEMGSIYYINEDGEAATLPVPSALPAEYTLSSQNGFSVFTLGDKLYQVRPMQRSGKNWGSDFLICDEEGNVIFSTAYGTEYGTEQAATGNGCNLVTHKVSDTKVELYQVFTNNSAAHSFAAMYEITIPGGDDPTPEPIYMAGAFQEWHPEDAVELPVVDGKYVYTFTDKAENGFKLSTVKGDWDAFNAGVIGAADDNMTYTLTPDVAVKLEAGKKGNLSAPSKGEWTITIDPATMELTLTGEAEGIETLYAVGAFQDWNVANPSVFTKAEDGKLTLALSQAEGQFKLSTSCNGQWDGEGSFNAGVIGAAGDITLAVDQPVQLFGGNNNNISFPSKADWTLSLDPKTMILTLLGEGGDDPVATVPSMVYVIGGINDWKAEESYALLPKFDIENPVANQNGEYEYSVNLDALFGEFKLGGKTLDEFDYGAQGEDPVVAADKTNQAWAGSNVNFTLDGKQYTDVTLTFFYNPDKTKASWLKFEGTEFVETPEVPELPMYIFVRGEMLDWAAEYQFALTPTFDVENPVANENGEYEYSVKADYFFGNFKLGDNGDWSKFNYGAQGEDPVIAAGKTNQAWAGSDVNFDLEGKQYQDVTFTFYYNPDSTKPSWLKFEGTEYVEPVPTTDKAVFAYGLTREQGENNTYTLKYFSTGDAAKAVLVLTKADDESVVVEEDMGPVVKGENTYNLDANNLPADGKYFWTVRIHNYSIPETVFSEPVSVGASRSGLVVFTDPEYPQVYGKVVIGRTQNGGLDIYAPDGTLEASEVHKNCAPIGGTAANTSSPMDGKQRGTEAVMASWGDSSYGVVAFDIANLDVEPYSVFEGVKQSNGTVMNGDIKVGSGTPCVAFSGTGENTRMYTFDEDIFNNHLAYNLIGENKTVGTALIDLGYASLLGNTNVGMWGTENGLFLTQMRANGMESGTPGLAYFDNEEGEVIWQASDMAETDAKFLPSAAAGVCINPAGDLLAVSTYTGIEVYLLSWDGNKPVLEKYMTVASPYANGTRTNIQFDPANNIHATNQTNHCYYTVALADEEPIANTAAPSASFIEKTTGVENIVLGADNEGAVYYNLNGVRVDADNLVPGVYVKVVGKVATKVVVK